MSAETDSASGSASASANASGSAAASSSASPPTLSRTLSATDLVKRMDVASMSPRSAPQAQAADGPATPSSPPAAFTFRQLTQQTQPEQPSASSSAASSSASPSAPARGSVAASPLPRIHPQASDQAQAAQRQSLVTVPSGGGANGTHAADKRDSHASAAGAASSASAPFGASSAASHSATASAATSPFANPSASSPDYRHLSLLNGQFVSPISAPAASGSGSAQPLQSPFIDNRIRSARYTWFTFFPLNLFAQLSRPANFYFICIAILQVIPQISISNGEPTILLPLLIVLIVSMIKDGIEDWKRNKADREENDREYVRLTFTHPASSGNNGSGAKGQSATPPPPQAASAHAPSAHLLSASFETVLCSDIQVGDILKIEDEQPIPADLFLLYSSLEQCSTKGGDKRAGMNRSNTKLSLKPATGPDAFSSVSSSNPYMLGGTYAYVETSNLDGESNLKIKLATDFCRPLCDEPSLLRNGHFDFRVEQPNGKLDKFGGHVCKTSGKAPAGRGSVVAASAGLIEEQILTLEHLLLRGSRLKNTGFVYGIVLYTGEESKIRANSRARAAASIKRSSVEQLMNRQIFIMFVLQTIFCFIGGILANVWQSQHSAHTYLFVQQSAALVGFERFFTWYIIFSGFVPISLLVSMEIVKFAQGVFIGFDIGMCHFTPKVEVSKSKTADENEAKRRKENAAEQEARKKRRAALGFDEDESEPEAEPSDAKSKSSDTTRHKLLSSSASSSSPSKDASSIPGDLNFARAQSSGLNEELGQIGFILSDKTGTLTCNSMDFRKCFIGSHKYGTGSTDMASSVKLNADPKLSGEPEIDQDSWESALSHIEGTRSSMINLGSKFHLPPHLPHVNFNARDQMLLSLQAMPATATNLEPGHADTHDMAELKRQQQDVHSFCMLLALCNSVFPTLNEYDKIIYKASSPDEEALVEFARFHGYELEERSPPFVKLNLTGPAANVALDTMNIIPDATSSGHLRPPFPVLAPQRDSLRDSLKTVQIAHCKAEFEQLALLDFTSKRKRMSVILREFPAAAEPHAATSSSAASAAALTLSSSEKQSGGRIWVLCKGADVTMQPLLWKNHGAQIKSISQAQPHWAVTERALTGFSDEGLRTLVCAVAVLPLSWWDDPVNGWGVKYAKRMKDLAVEGPAEEGHFKGACMVSCRRCVLEEEMELSARLALVGGTAIEDKLQHNVPATIKSLLEAGIKLWVLTGDKLETAVNIGMASNLLEAAMVSKGNLFRIEGDDFDDIKNTVNLYYKKVRQMVAKEKPGGRNLDPDEPEDDADSYARARAITSTASALKINFDQVQTESQQTYSLPPVTRLSVPLGLVLEASAYTILQSAVSPGKPAISSALFRKFLYIATHCKSVIACRCQPSTKSNIVSIIRETQGVTTLAIGDGANDEQMIRTAHVGVGIRGVEGSTAVQASDYAISQFKFLRRLLFVHGHNNLRRISTLISYIFYKTSMMCFCVFWFGIFSGFSGQNLVMEWAYQCYNVVFTALPILIYALFDRDIAPEVLEQHPSIYRRSSMVGFRWQLCGKSIPVSGSRYFNVQVFWMRWMSFSFLHSLIIFFLPYSLYQSTSIESSGASQGMWELGIVVYTCVVLVTNLKLALLFRSWTWLHHVSLWGSIAVYFGIMLLFDASTIFATAGGDYYGAVSRLYSTPSVWVTIFITVLAALYCDIIMEAVERFGDNKELVARFGNYLKMRRQTRGPKRAPSSVRNETSQQASSPIISSTTGGWERMSKTNKEAEVLTPPAGSPSKRPSFNPAPAAATASSPRLSAAINAKSVELSLLPPDKLSSSASGGDQKSVLAKPRLSSATPVIRPAGQNASIKDSASSSPLSVDPSLPSSLSPPTSPSMVAVAASPTSAAAILAARPVSISSTAGASSSDASPALAAAALPTSSSGPVSPAMEALRRSGSAISAALQRAAHRASLSGASSPPATLPPLPPGPPPPAPPPWPPSLASQPPVSRISSLTISPAPSQPPATELVRDASVVDEPLLPLARLASSTSFSSATSSPTASSLPFETKK